MFLARLMSPQFGRPYMKTNKNDARDAEAICEAVARPSMRLGDQEPGSARQDGFASRVGPLIATAVVASVGNAQEFRSGRELAAFFELVPRHYASGRRTVMLPIAKSRRHYLRTLLVHGELGGCCLQKT